MREITAKSRRGIPKGFGFPRRDGQKLDPYQNPGGRTMWRLLKHLAVVVVLIGLSDASFASVDGAAQFIDRLGNQTLQIHRSSDLTYEQRESRFRSLLKQGLDLPFIGRFVLGKYWRLATPEQQRDYLALFSEYALQTYSARLVGYTGQTMTVIGARRANEKDVVIRTTIKRPNGPPFIADWRVRTTGDRYRIIDIMIEDISMVVTRRSEFASVVLHNGIEGLLAVLRARTTKVMATAPVY